MQSSSFSFTEHVVNDCHLLVPGKKKKKKNINGEHEKYQRRHLRHDTYVDM